MESTQELRHWGIKGQRWGIRRYQNPDGTLTEAGKKRYYYQNPDGSLTEAGKKDYMKAAKKGKLDVSKLSDADLNMINSRFAREKTFKQNVSDYEKSTFTYRLKEAALARIKGSGGGGGGGKGKGGGSGIAKMLAMPIKKAFTDAFTEQKGGKGKNKGGDDEDEERREARDYRRWKKHGRRFTDHYVSDLKDEQVTKALRDKDVDRGRLYLGHKKGKMGVDDSVGRLGVTDATRNGTDYMQRRLEERRAAREAAKDPALKAQRREENRQRQEAAARRRERELEERAKKSGIIIGHSAIVIRRNSSDELYHWGIKGQKWGVRRFENADGTLTPEGRERYGSGNGQSYIGGANRAKRETAMIDKETDPKKKSDAMQKMLDDLYEDRTERYEKYSKGEEIEKSDKTEYLDEASSWLMDKIIKESGDWYWNEPVSDANKKISKDIDDLNDNIEKEYVKSTGKNWYGGFLSDKERKKYPAISEMVDKMQQLQNDRLGVVLIDIGMKDTPDNRAKIRDYVYWD